MQTEDEWPHMPVALLYYPKSLIRAIWDNIYNVCYFLDFFLPFFWLVRSSTRTLRNFTPAP